MAFSMLHETTSLTDLQRAIMRTVVYFDLFRHPMRKEEIRRFLQIPCTNEERFTEGLDALCAEGILTNRAGFYAPEDPSRSIAERKADEERARTRMAKALRMSRFIGCFPFVRAVMLSGSMSKGRCAADGDIDYFVITQPGRLWIARTLLVLYKKVFLLNDHRNLCVNYFVDTDHLAIEDRNLFTATEVMTLIPTWNGPQCAAFFRANEWAQRILPNTLHILTDHLTGKDGWFKRMFERALGGAFVDEVDEWCMRRTLDHWRARFPEFDRSQFDTALRSRRYVSKHHPRDFQRRVLDAFQQRWNAFERDHVLEPTTSLIP